MTFVHGNYLIDVGCVLVWSLSTCGVLPVAATYKFARQKRMGAFEEEQPPDETANNYSSTLFSINA